MAESIETKGSKQYKVYGESNPALKDRHKGEENHPWELIILNVPIRTELDINI